MVKTIFTAAPASSSSTSPRPPLQPLDVTRPQPPSSSATHAVFFSARDTPSSIDAGDTRLTSAHAVVYVSGDTRRLLRLRRHTPSSISRPAGSTHDPLPQCHHWRLRTGRHMARRPRLAAASALFAAPLNHRCFAGRAHRWLARVLQPRRASHVRHVAALQAASRRALRLRQRPRAATGNLAARCARALMRDAAHGSAGRRAAWPPPLSSTKLLIPIVGFAQEFSISLALKN